MKTGKFIPDYRIKVVVLIACFFIFCSGYIFAQPSITFTFKGTSFSWQTPQNWQPAGPPGPDDVAIIPFNISGVYDFDKGVNAFPPTIWYYPSEVRDVICNGSTAWYPWGTEGLIIHRNLIIGQDAPAVFNWLDDLYITGPTLWDTAFGYLYDNGTLKARKIMVGTGAYTGLFRIGHLRSYVITDTLHCGEKGLLALETGGNLIIKKRMDIEGDLDIGNLQLDLRGSGHITGSLNSSLFSKLRLGKNSLTVGGNLNFEYPDQLYFSLIPGYGQIVASGFGILNNCIVNIDTAVDGIHKIISSVGGILNVTIGQIPTGTQASQFSVIYQGNSEVWIQVTGLPVGNAENQEYPMEIKTVNNSISIHCNDFSGEPLRLTDLQGKHIQSVYPDGNYAEMRADHSGLYILEIPLHQAVVRKKIAVIKP